MKPNLICNGSGIGIYCGSRQLHEKDLDNYNNAIKFFFDNDFNVFEDKNLYSLDKNYFYPSKQRAEYFNSLIKNYKVNVVLSCKGGADTISMLDYIDYKEIKKNPKIICGYSDISIIVNYVNYKTGIVTYWGPNVTLLGKSEAEFCRQEFISHFKNGVKTIGRKTDKYSVIRQGVAYGKLIGGTISSIAFLVKGKYKINFSNKILFLEDFGKKVEPLKIKGYLAYLKQNKVFDKIKGLWVGNHDNEFKYSLEKDLLELTKDYNFPIIKSNNFGHIYENMIIPIGVNAKIDTYSNNLVNIY